MRKSSSSCAGLSFLLTGTGRSSKVKERNATEHDGRQSPNDKLLRRFSSLFA